MYISQLLQSLCNYPTNSPRYSRKVSYFNVQISGQNYNVQVNQTLVAWSTPYNPLKYHFYYCHNSRKYYHHHDSQPTITTVNNYPTIAHPWSICDWILETNQIVTLGLFHFVGSANSYTHTLSMHSGINRLSWLVYFSRASFTDHVNSQLKQKDHWMALQGRHGSEIHSSGSKMSLTSS